MAGLAISPCVSYLTGGNIYLFTLVTVVGGITYHNATHHNCSVTSPNFCKAGNPSNEHHPFPSREGHPFSAWVLSSLFTVCKASFSQRLIYGSDCQGLLKPIQFQDSGSYFLSFMAHLMNSYYQLTCFIIVKLWLKWYIWKKKKITREKKKRGLSLHFPHPVPKIALPEVCSPIIQPPCDLLTWQTDLLTPLLQSCACIYWAMYFAYLGLF